ncbi:hypothetical protein [Treponema bryantii]|uniref:hypothetical protein n=1 Tax=Treponema bryantii TaxID=163 RepID=UPI0003B489AE|nr:hypothetical protein [Treponema bryantii]
MNENDEPCTELNELIYQISGEFWKQAYFQLCILQEEYKPLNESSTDVLSQLKKGIKSIAKKSGLKYSAYSHNNHYYISIVPFPIYVGIDKKTNDFTVSVPHINSRSFAASDWERGLKWIQDYINIDIKPLIEKTEEVRDKFYLNLKTADIVKASILALCNSVLREKCLDYKINQNRLKSDIIARISKDEKYHIQIYHKPFSIDSSDVLKLFKTPHEMEIEDKLYCRKETE